MRHSKKTLALLARYPTLEDWIINNLSADQLHALMNAPMWEVAFGDSHPLTSQRLGVELWRAYWDQVVFELECLLGEDEDHAIAPTGCDRNAYFHESVCFAIGNYAREQDELMDGVIERQKQEIAQAMAAVPMEQAASRPRL
ncbi:hypothetical protein SAMN05518669_101803 [Variovorax sp. YR634]|uniref:hypothetical protein n=1 Tax=Variovorax sp. YR634 TaxID=1884385 RepID=UPI000897B9C4|nr:hypothetical protein [Variovorax sp. YR634]SDW49977.1 hypothetical protein SAMN05518669_101803 [Variovorax sp. YR634]